MRGGKSKDKVKDGGEGDSKGGKKSTLEVSVGAPETIWRVGKRVRPIVGKSWAASLYGGQTNKSFPVKLATNGSVAFDHHGLNLKVSWRKQGGGGRKERTEMETLMHLIFRWEKMGR